MKTLIDGCNLLWRIANIPSFTYLSTADGIGTGIVFGFVRNLLLLNAEASRNVIVVWDGANGKAWRQKIHPEYKSNRAKKEESDAYNAVIGQIDRLSELLSALGIDQLASEDHEADDVIANICRNGNDQIAIVTEDKDMLQLVGDRVDVIQPIKNQRVKKHNFAQLIKHDNARSYLHARAIMGKADKSDNVSGLKGIGEVTARDIIRRFGSLQRMLRQIDRAQIEFKRLQSFDEDQIREVCERNLKLMDLRSAAPEEMPELNVKTTAGVFNLSAVDRLFEKYEFNSLHKALRSWQGG